MTPPFFERSIDLFWKGADLVLAKRLIQRSFLCFLVLASYAGAEGEAKKLGDESDGSRAHPVHRIPLMSEEGEKIAADDDPLLPFSTKETCGACHSYATVSKGWHFNAVDAGPEREAHGRVGQPWILADGRTGVQIPISTRPWPGVFSPGQAGLSSRMFVKIFGRHMPGGGLGEVASDDPDDIMRSMVSGYLEVNCLACHDGDPGHNQAEYAGQTVRENFRWAAAATCSFAKVSGSAKDMPDTYDPMMPEPPADPKLVPPGIAYQNGVFGEDGSVLLDIQRETPSHRCYFCHSNLSFQSDDTEKWTSDEDIHLKAGMTCVDCHRNGIDHNIVRGYEGEVSDNILAARSSCKGCHLGGATGAEPTGGRFGAPVPEHKGLPPVHFERIGCTGCHSGPWPGKETYLTKTSRAHRLGTLGVNKSAEALPHVLSPVFAQAEDGKIAPHKLVWPSFWGDMTDANIVPVDFDTVSRVITPVLADANRPVGGGWAEVTTGHVAKGLGALAKAVKGTAVYVSGGKVYKLADGGGVAEEQGHPAAKPYMWPIAHDVRPAAQSLGIRYCTDCHATDAPFFFGDVAVDSPIAAERDKARQMAEFQDIDATYAKMFAMSFVFRPMLKIVSLCSCAVLGLVLLLYGLLALRCVVRVFCS